MHIFLDIDGVLNNKDSWKTLYFLDKNCTKIFADIAKELRAKVVLTSSWRTGFDTTGANHSLHIKRLIEMFSEFGIEIDGKTPVSKDDNRSVEIDYYIRRHPEVGGEYIVLDDDKSLFNDANIENKVTKHLYLVDYRTGLTEKDKKNIIKMAKRVNRL